MKQLFTIMLLALLMAGCKKETISKDCPNFNGNFLIGTQTDSTYSIRIMQGFMITDFKLASYYCHDTIIRNVTGFDGGIDFGKYLVSDTTYTFSKSTIQDSHGKVSLPYKIDSLAFCPMFTNSTCKSIDTDAKQCLVVTFK